MADSSGKKQEEGPREEDGEKENKALLFNETWKSTRRNRIRAQDESKSTVRVE